MQLFHIRRDEHRDTMSFFRTIVLRIFSRVFRRRTHTRFMMQPDIARLIGKLQEAGLEPEAWPDTLKLLTNTLGIAGAARVISNKITGRVDWVCFPV
jgi:hypothetical protein